MTRPATITQAALDRAAKAVAAQRVTVTITARDGTVYTIAPMLDEKPELAQPDDWFGARKAKREGRREGRS